MHQYYIQTVEIPTPISNAWYLLLILGGNIVPPPILQQKCSHAHFWIYCPPLATHIFRWQHNCLPWFANIASEMSTKPLLYLMSNICYTFSIMHFSHPTQTLNPSSDTCYLSFVLDSSITWFIYPTCLMLNLVPDIFYAFFLVGDIILLLNSPYTQYHIWNFHVFTNTDSVPDIY